MNSTSSVIDSMNLSYEVISNTTGIEKVDQNEAQALEMFSYTEGTDMESPSVVRNSRGLVYADKKLIMKTFGYTPEFLEKDIVSVMDFFINQNVEHLEQCFVFDSEEGALIRIFYHDEKWHVATHRKLDAFRSKWSTQESFGSIFERALIGRFESSQEFEEYIGTEGKTHPEKILEIFLSKLDNTHVHTFLVSNTEENRIVCMAPSVPRVNYVGSFSPDGKEYTFAHMPLLTPRRHSFPSITAMCNHVRDINHHFLQGLIVITPGLQACKIINSNYRYYYELRGNCPSVRFRYLQIRTLGTKNANYRSLYPHFGPDFDEIEQIIQQIARNIHTAYIARFINKQFARVSPDEYRIIRECHGQHIADRNFKVTFERVYEALNKQTPVTLNRMIKAFKNPKKDEQVKETESAINPEEVIEKPKIAIKKIVEELWKPDAEFMEHLSALPEEERRNVLGERLFPMIIARVGEEYAPKITGMMIELDSTELLGMFNNVDILESAIEQAVSTLESS